MDALDGLLERGEAAGKNAKRRSLWSQTEDVLIREHVHTVGSRDWSKLAESINAKLRTERTAKSCRLRWFNELAPSINRAPFSQEEMKFIMNQIAQVGTAWSQIAAAMAGAGMPGRTDNAIKNCYHVRLKRVMQEQGLAPGCRAAPAPAARWPADAAGAADGNVAGVSAAPPGQRWAPAHDQADEPLRAGPPQAAVGAVAAAQQPGAPRSGCSGMLGTQQAAAMPSASGAPAPLADRSALDLGHQGGLQGPKRSWDADGAPLAGHTSSRPRLSAHAGADLDEGLGAAACAQTAAGRAGGLGAAAVLACSSVGLGSRGQHGTASSEGRQVDDGPSPSGAARRFEGDGAPATQQFSSGLAEAVAVAAAARGGPVAWVDGDTVTILEEGPVRAAAASNSWRLPAGEAWGNAGALCLQDTAPLPASSSGPRLEHPLPAGLHLAPGVFAAAMHLTVPSSQLFTTTTITTTTTTSANPYGVASEGVLLSLAPALPSRAPQLAPCGVHGQGAHAVAGAAQQSGSGDGGTEPKPMVLLQVCEAGGSNVLPGAQQRALLVGGGDADGTMGGIEPACCLHSSTSGLRAAGLPVLPVPPAAVLWDAAPPPAGAAGAAPAATLAEPLATWGTAAVPLRLSGSAAAEQQPSSGAALLADAAQQAGDSAAQVPARVGKLVVATNSGDAVNSGVVQQQQQQQGGGVWLLPHGCAAAADALQHTQLAWQLHGGGGKPAAPQGAGLGGVPPAPQPYVLQLIAAADGGGSAPPQYELVGVPLGVAGDSGRSADGAKNSSSCSFPSRQDPRPVLRLEPLAYSRSEVLACSAGTSWRLAPAAVPCTLVQAFDAPAMQGPAAVVSAGPPPPPQRRLVYASGGGGLREEAGASLVDALGDQLVDARGGCQAVGLRIGGTCGARDPGAPSAHRLSSNAPFMVELPWVPGTGSWGVQLEGALS